eukprot:3028221-Rhodomonas_salina.1
MVGETLVSNIAFKTDPTLDLVVISQMCCGKLYVAQRNLPGIYDVYVPVIVTGNHLASSETLLPWIMSLPRCRLRSMPCMDRSIHTR